MPLGAVRVSERVPAGREGEREGDEGAACPRGAERSTGSAGGSGGGRLVGIGGTIRNLAAAAMKRLELPDIDVQGFELTRDALEELIEQLADRPASKRGPGEGHQVRPRAT